MFLVLSNLVFASFSQERGFGFQIVDGTYPQSLGVKSNFRFYLHDYTNSMIDFENSYNNNVEFYDIDSTYYTYPVDTYLPYTLFSCSIYCDSSRNSDGYLSVFIPDLISHYQDPYTSTTYYEENINCKYDEWLTGKNVTQSVKCFLVPNAIYTEGIYSLNYGAYDFDVIKDDYNSLDNENYFNYCGSPIWGNNIDVCSNILEFKYSVKFIVRPEGTAFDNTIYPISVEDSPDFNDSSSDFIDDSDIDTDLDGDNTGKLSSYNDLASVVRKKNITLWNLIFIEELIFSLILILFYIFELAVTIFVFTSWIPGIFKAIVNIIRKFGEV